MFRLQGKVLKNFNDKNDNLKVYNSATEYQEADIFIAERDRYLDLYSKGYVEKGTRVKEEFKLKKED